MFYSRKQGKKNKIFQTEAQEHYTRPGYLLFHIIITPEEVLIHTFILVVSYKMTQKEDFFLGHCI
jgi:hypothetical protein